MALIAFKPWFYWRKTQNRNELSVGNALGVFLAGGIGCLSRYLAILYVYPIMGFPIATLVVNVCGGFLAGVVVVKVPQFKPILLAGFLGGFTTFSAFSLECLTMIQNQQILNAVAYILASVFLSIGATWVGYTISG